MRIIFSSIVLMVCTNLYAAPVDVLKVLDQKPLRSAKSPAGKPYAAIYAMCGEKSNTVMYRIITTSIRYSNGIGHVNDIYLHLYNGQKVRVHKPDCKFFNIAQ